MIARIKLAQVKIILLLLLAFSIGIAFGYGYFTKTQKVPSISVDKNTPHSFVSEVYDKIKENYWDNISDAQLLDLFRLSIEKASGKVQIGNFSSKDQLVKAVEEVVKSMNDEQKKQFVRDTAGAVLISLNPPGRSGLFTQKQEEQLKNRVENIDPEKDLYKDLGLAKGAILEEVNEAFQKQSEDLKKQASPAAQQKLKQITYAKEVLSQKEAKSRYDQKGVEPTIFTKQIGQTLYLQFKKFSPTSLDEFQKAFETHKDVDLSSLILDLRGNVGGAIDATAYFLGFFLGKGQYAFDFYHKGEYKPFKTPTDKLASISKYKQIIILVDNQTQSSAEMMVASFKKYRVGVVVGVSTKGWGTVERVFPLENQLDPKEKYSIFLVHSITLRDDNQSIEGRGVDPDISVKNPDWEKLLFEYFRNENLIKAVKSIL